jgi:hypothetical protein
MEITESLKAILGNYFERVERTKIPESLPKQEYLHATRESTPEYQREFFKKLSEQVGLWSVYNFGIQLPHRPALGMIEELNELKYSLDKLDTKQVIDAVGDITIYMADYCSIRGWDMGDVWALRDPMPITTIPEMPGELSRWLAHSHLKGEQGIRGGSAKHDERMQSTCASALWYCLGVSNAFGVDYLEVAAKVWGEVKLRDWRKKKDTAHMVAELQIKDELTVRVTTSQPLVLTGETLSKAVAEAIPHNHPPTVNYEVGDEENEF